MKRLLIILLFSSFLVPAQTVNIDWFGGKKSIKYLSQKNPKAVKLNPSNSTDALLKAIEYIKSNRGVGTIIINDHYVINPTETIVIPNGINLLCEGNSTISTDFDGTLFRVEGHYRSKFRLNINFKMHDPMNSRWWLQKGDDAPRNEKSVAIEILNTRKSEFDIQVNGFVKGIYLKGDGDGTVENTIRLGDIRNCRYGIYIDGENGGWVNQNRIIGGRINLVKTNRDPSERLHCAAIYSSGGDNNTFQDINLEGNSDYQYVIDDRGVLNHYIYNRYEGIRAGQINIPTWFGGHTIIGGYGYTPFLMAYPSKFYDPTGTIKKKGYLHVHRSASFYQGNGNMYLGGDQVPTPTSTLTVKNEHLNGTILELQKRTGEAKALFRANGEIILHTGNNDYVDLKKLAKMNGDLNEIEYKEGEVYGVGDWFGNYYATKIFTATSWDKDLELGNIRKNVPSYPPIIMKDGIIYAKGFKNIKEYKGK